jgi:hypothetical protein
MPPKKTTAKGVKGKAKAQSKEEAKVQKVSKSVEKCKYSP